MFPSGLLERTRVRKSVLMLVQIGRIAESSEQCLLGSSIGLVSQ